MVTLGLQVKPVTTSAEHDTWDHMAARSAVAHRHQCLWWMEPLERYGIRSRALGCWSGGRLVGGILLRSYAVPFTGTTIIECLDGPIFAEWESAWADAFLAALEQEAREANGMAVIIKGCPGQDVHRDVMSALARRGCQPDLRPGPEDAILPLQGRTLDQIRSGFSRGTRANVKKGQKALGIRRLTRSEDLALAYAAWTATAKRKSFTDLRPWRALEPVLRHCIDHQLGWVLGSFVDEHLLAAAFVTQVGKTASYVYGGYLDGAEKHNPTHVLQFEAIKQSLEAGLERYNFGNLLAEYQPSARGVDQFKLGFGAVPERHLNTITWVRKPLLYACVQRAKQVEMGRRLENIFKRRLIKRAE